MTEETAEVAEPEVVPGTDAEQAAEAPPEPETDAPEAPEGDDEPTIEDMAREIGWNPDGEKKAWEFVKYGIDRNAELKRRFDEQNERLSRTEQASMATAKWLADQARKDERDKWQEKFDAGIKSDDPEAVREAHNKIVELDAQSIAPQQTGPSPVQQQFASENPWYGQDPAATDLAANVTVQNAHLPVDQQLKLAKETVERAFPQYAPAKQEAKKPAAVSKPKARGGNAKPADPFARMPAENQRIAKKMEKDFGQPGLAKEYAANYWANQEADNG